MKWLFEKVDGQAQLEVVLKKATFDQEVHDLVAYLEGFELATTDIVPIKTVDRVQLLAVAELISVEVEEGDLLLTSTKGNYRTTERLARFQDRVQHPDLVQISRFGLLNIKHLQYLEHSFSGNMTAFLTDQVKITVSRRYLKNLEKKIGL